MSKPSKKSRKTVANKGAVASAFGLSPRVENIVRSVPPHLRSDKSSYLDKQGNVDIVALMLAAMREVAANDQWTYAAILDLVRYGWDDCIPPSDRKDDTDAALVDVDDRVHELRRDALDDAMPGIVELVVRA